jgi:ketosteroid isomerase-like protein
MTTAVEDADRLYQRWNDDGLAVLGDCVDPAIVLIPDPLRPVESALRGLAGWEQWVARWEDAYEDVHITVDALVPMDGEHVLALVSITATPIGATDPLGWAAAHLWTLRDGRIAGWATHLDLAAARETLYA